MTSPKPFEEVAQDTIETISKLLNSAGTDCSVAGLLPELAYALGHASAHERLRQILLSDLAVTRPMTAYQLALDSALPAAEVLKVLASMAPETEEEPDDDRLASAEQMRASGKAN